MEKDCERTLLRRELIRELSEGGRSITELSKRYGHTSSSPPGIAQARGFLLEFSSALVLELSVIHAVLPQNEPGDGVVIKLSFPRHPITEGPIKCSLVELSINFLAQPAGTL
jgi:hypothetical protein